MYIYIYIYIYTLYIYISIYTYGKGTHYATVDNDKEGSTIVVAPTGVVVAAQTNDNDEIEVVLL